VPALCRALACTPGDLLEYQGQRTDTPADRERYQTVFAAAPGAVAAPTAGLHFTPPILARLECRGIAVVRVTLHVGLGTFQPVTVERVEDHRLHEERFVLTAAAAAAINERRAAGGRVVAVGTTSVRVLESCAAADGRVTAQAGRTALFLHPPQQPRAVDALLTNFHMPRSTLLALISAFAGRERKEMILIDSGGMNLAEMPTKGGKEMDEKTVAERVIHSLKEMFAGREDPGTEKGRSEEAERISELSRQVVELKEMLEREKETRSQAESRLAAFEEDIARKEREAELLKFSSALEQAAREDRITPAELAGYLKLGSRLDAEGRRAILEEVAGREPSILFRELAPSREEKNSRAAEMDRQRARFEKFPEDPEHVRALKLMAASPGLSFGEAIERVRLGSK
jgi:hypothetical protein